MLVADMGAVAVFAAVARTGVIDVDISAGGEPCGQELVLLVVERVVIVDEEAVELTRGDIDAPLVELAQQQRLSDALVVVLVDDVADKRRAEVGVVQMRGQLPDEALAVGGLIARESVAGVERLNDEVLDEEVLVAAPP